MVCANDEQFSAGDELYLEMLATHGYSPTKTGGSYHSLILTSEYATPTCKLNMQ